MFAVWFMICICKYATWVNDLLVLWIKLQTLYKPNVTWWQLQIFFIYNVHTTKCLNYWEKAQEKNKQTNKHLLSR